MGVKDVSGCTWGGQETTFGSCGSCSVLPHGSWRSKSGNHLSQLNYLMVFTYFDGMLVWHWTSRLLWFKWWKVSWWVRARNVTKSYHLADLTREVSWGREHAEAASEQGWKGKRVGREGTGFLGGYSARTKEDTQRVWWQWKCVSSWWLMITYVSCCR